MELSREEKVIGITKKKIFLILKGFFLGGGLAKLRIICLWNIF